MGRDVQREFARRIVERVAPDQLRGFDTQADAWFDDPKRARSGDRVGNDPLTAGLATAIAEITPVAMFIADHILSSVLDTTIAEVSKRALGRLRRAKPKDVPAPAIDATAKPFDPAAVVTAYEGDFERIHETARTAGRAYGLGAEGVDAIAAAVLAVLRDVPEQPPQSRDVNQVADE